MGVLSNLEPKAVFGFFEEICKIPHGSGNTKEISDYLVAFAKARNLEHYQDDINNVIIIKEATAGYENAEPVILQGHIDMVCEKAPHCTIDMEREGLSLVTEGDLVYAKDTTLGGDDGIAVAMAMAILDANNLSHPRIEAIFTVDEEIGLIGAGYIDVSPLKGRKMINIDSEEEGIFTVSCAGGINAKCTLPINREAYEGNALSITVGGLLGGHSGVEIHKGRGNSNTLMGRVLYAVSRCTDIRIAAVSGGLKENAIPRNTEAVILAKDKEKVLSVCQKMLAEIKNEYSLTDPDIFIEVKDTDCSLAMDKKSTDNVIFMLNNLPNGVIEMSAGIEGLVQTSLNLGIFKTEENEVTAEFGVRSSIDSQKEMLCQKLECFMENIGGKTELSGNYAGWEYRKDSPLRDLMAEVYKEQYGKAPEIKAIHAGLECGMFAGKISDFDAVSIGPDIMDIHTFTERLSISSTKRVYEMLVEILRRMK